MLEKLKKSNILRKNKPRNPSTIKFRQNKSQTHPFWGRVARARLHGARALIPRQWPPDCPKGGEFDLLRLL